MCICSMYIKHQKIISKTISMSDVQNGVVIIFSPFDQTDNLEFQYDSKDIPKDKEN